jgi:outer membrane protein TolC
VSLLLSFGLIFASVTTEAAEKIRLSQKTVAERLLSQSFKSKEILLSAEQTRLALAQASAGYDFNMSLESGYELSKIPNFLGTQPDQDQAYKSTFLVKKPISTGTLLELEYTRLSKNTSYPATSTIAAPAEQTEDYFGIKLEQSLLKNIFGRVDRAKLRAAQANFDAAQTNRNDDLQNLVLEGIRLYWKSYVAQETFNDSIKSRERYQKLVEAVRKKTSYGYNNPGELAQVQAELETRIQNVKTRSTEYLGLISDLVTLLHLPPGSEIEFDVPNDLPGLAKTPEKNVDDLRSVKALRKLYEASEDNLIAASNSELPDLALVGKYYQYGLKPTASEANSEMLGGSKPDYYVGVKLSYSFGSGLQSADAKNKTWGKELAESVLHRRRLELQDALEKTSRTTQSTLAIYESAKAQKGYREKAAQEQSKAYAQGRTDLNTLITSLNNYFESEIVFTRSIGDYLTALNEFAALRDELIPDLKTETQK